MRSIRLKMRRNIYKREFFPYDMKAMLSYAKERNVPLHTLSTKEISQFLLRKPAT